MDITNLGKFKKLLHASSNTYASIATSNIKGEPNVAPVGSAFLEDDKTITLLKGPLNRTYSNLQENAEAVFMVVNKSMAKWVKYFLRGKSKECFGYRLYVRLREERAATDEEISKSFRRFGFMMGLKGGQRIKSTINKLLVFDLIEIREVTF